MTAKRNASRLRALACAVVGFIAGTVFGGGGFDRLVERC